MKNNEGTKFARKCDDCGKGMNEGYCINNGEKYYCTEICLYHHISAKEWNSLYSDEGDSYWTQWEMPFDAQYIIKNNKLVDYEG